MFKKPGEKGNKEDGDDIKQYWSGKTGGSYIPVKKLKLKFKYWFNPLKEKAYELERREYN